MKTWCATVPPIKRCAWSSQRPDPDIPKFDQQGLVRCDAESGVLRLINLALGDAVDLKANEALLERLVKLFVGEIFHQMTVHPGLYPRPFCHDAQLIPTVINRKGMTLINLLL